MLKNGQTVKLGDGCTTLAACGEVSITFTRDKWSVKFEGIVVEKLNCDLYGGMTFHVDNDITSPISVVIYFAIIVINSQCFRRRAVG